MGTFVKFLFLIEFLIINAQEDDPYRLPPNYKVIHQHIDLVVPADCFTSNSRNYTGTVVITFQLIEKASTIYMHASSNIDLQTIELNGGNSISTNYPEWAQNSTTDILSLIFSEELSADDELELKITYKAQLLDGGGFYKVSYLDDKNETQYIATTQFQATSARNAFPCFDEPTYKSTFAYSLTYPAEFTAWTNTKSVNSTDPTENGLITTYFDTTPKMSSYLVAFTISKYNCSSDILEGNSSIEHSVCSRSDKVEARTWAMSITQAVIEHLNDYTGMNYSLFNIPKLDQMAVPGKSGAMENWGLVIYGETALLFDNNLQTVANKRSIAGIISHELSHQWFGNLLTCKWWSETFLNEGFATMFQYYTTHYAVPEFQMETFFPVAVLQPILQTEGNLNVPALRSNASTQSEISAKFGSYTYSKGGSVLRMIEHIMGRAIFKAGIKTYIENHQYEAVEPQNLWDDLQSEIDKQTNNNLPTDVELSVVVDTWINKGGHPVLYVEWNGSDITVSQKRFLYSGVDTEGHLWHVPVSYTTSSANDFNEDTSPKGWVIENQTLSIEFKNETGSEWIVINNQETGFYRVNYDTILWENLASALKQTNFSGIHVINRAQIVDDSYNLARANQLTLGQALKNVEFLANDTEYFSWYPAVNFFSYLIQRTGSTSPLGAALTNHFLLLLNNAVEKHSLSNVNENEYIQTLGQALVNTYACKYGNDACVSAAKSHFNNYKTNGTKPNINIRSLVYCTAIRFSDEPSSDWNFLYELYKNPDESNDLSAIWAALGCATNSTVLKAFLNKTLEPDGTITSSQMSSVFSAICSASEAGLIVTIDYFVENYEAIGQVVSELDLTTILNGMADYITQEAQISKFENLINSTTMNTTLSEAIQNAITRAKSNREIIDLNKSSLYEYLGLTEDEEETTPTTNSTTSSSTTTSSSAGPTDPTDPSTTTPDSANSFRMTLGLFGMVLIAFVV